MATVQVNVNQTIKKPSYYHCFKLTDSNYALFDAKMDMPMIQGSIAIIKSVQLPVSSSVFYYKVNTTKGFYEKPPENTIEVKGGTGKYTKPPLRYKGPVRHIPYYHYFKLSTVLYVVFDSLFDIPLMYGSPQRVQAVINKLDKDSSVVFYYHEDYNIKNSFKFWMMYEGKYSKT